MRRRGWLDYEASKKGIFKLLILELPNKFKIQIDSYPRAQRMFSEVLPYKMVSWGTPRFSLTRNQSCAIIACVEIEET